MAPFRVRKWLRFRSIPAWNLAGVAASLGALVVLALSMLLGGNELGSSATEFTTATTTLATQNFAPDMGERLVAVIGDSYTAGTREGGQGLAGWPALVWTMLGEQGVSVEPEVDATGGSGYLNPGPAGVTFLDAVYRTVRPEDQLVVIMGGANDIGQPVDALRSAVRSTFLAARQNAPWAELLVVGPVWPGASPSAEALAVRDVITGVVREVGAVLVDPIEDRWLVDRPDLIGADGVHPTDGGHEYLAERLAPRIRTELVGRGN